MAGLSNFIGHKIAKGLELIENYGSILMPRRASGTWKMMMFRINLVNLVMGIALTIP
jgi:hypothetical protein